MVMATIKALTNLVKKKYC